MSIKRILVPFPGSVDHGAELDVALAAGRALGAYVEALFISEPLQARARLAGGEVGRAAAAAQVGWYVEERERLARDGRERFARACAANGIPIGAVDEQPGVLPAAS